MPKIEMNEHKFIGTRRDLYPRDLYPRREKGRKMVKKRLHTYI